MAKPTVTVKDVVRMGSCINGRIVHGHPFYPPGVWVLTSQAKYPEVLENKPEIVETMNTVYKVENWV